VCQPTLCAWAIRANSWLFPTLQALITVPRAACGENCWVATIAFTGRNFDHRKQWLEDRLIELANIFSISVPAYAVMGNHLDVVVHVDPVNVGMWSDDHIATLRFHDGRLIVPNAPRHRAEMARSGGVSRRGFRGRVDRARW